MDQCRARAYCINRHKQRPPSTFWSVPYPVPHKLPRTRAQRAPACIAGAAWAAQRSLAQKRLGLAYVNRFYPKTQLSWLARLDHSHCNSADPLSDWLEVCCVFYRPGPGGAMCVVWWWKVLESRGRGGEAPQGSRRPRGGCHRGLGHMHCDSAGPWQASASCRLRKGCQVR